MHGGLPLTPRGWAAPPSGKLSAASTFPPSPADADENGALDIREDHRSDRKARKRGERARTSTWEPHSLSQAPLSALKLFKGDTLVSKKEIKQAQRDRQEKKRNRENIALKKKKEEIETAFNAEVDIAERGVEPYKASTLKRWLKLAVYFLNNGGKLPEYGFLNDI
ncbi:uncharacterized protein LOC34623823 [Cyclospora cayetanensis]|uniref:Uncharacterized protein LOC34623823 n=1 Tax=Cyclospora cayetanensis TaxID=88456 RepID=A0A6P6RR80_9EIME|nr:uncharacterized protein LOC34623823 [Cyclospora cayetanensis]